jgi:hypothetical protein
MDVKICYAFETRPIKPSSDLSPGQRVLHGCGTFSVGVNLCCADVTGPSLSAIRRPLLKS